MPATPEPANPPEPDTMLRVLRQAQKDAAYLQVHRAEWQDQYPDHYIVVYNETLVSTSPNLHEALSQAQNKGIGPRHLTIEFLSTDESDLILRSAACR